MMPDPKLSFGLSSQPDPAEGAVSTDDLFSEPSSQAISTPDGELNGRGPDWFPENDDDANAALEDAGDFCAHKCPIFNACVEDACHVFRIQSRADSFRREGYASRVGVLDEQTIGVV